MNVVPLCEWLGPVIGHVTGQPAVGRLRRALALADGFQFLLVVCQTPRVAAGLCLWLHEAVSEEREATVSVTRISPYPVDPRVAGPDPLAERDLDDLVLSRLVDGGERNYRLVIVDAARAGARDVPAWRSLFSRLNERRNLFARDLVGSLVLLLPPGLELDLARLAPDLWSIRSLEITIRDLNAPIDPLMISYEGLAGADESRATASSAAAEVSPLRWLHLSDLHVGCRDAAAWWQLLDLFWRSVDEHLKIVGAPDLVLLTGDLTFKGDPAEFDHLTRFLEKLLARLPKAADGLPPLVVAVPGNHDLQRPSGRDADRFRLLRNYDKGRDDEDVAGLLDELWNQSDASFLRPLFAHYVAWFDGFIRPQALRPRVKLHASFFPGDLSVSLDMPGRFPLAVVGLNSAWIQYEGGDFAGKLALPVEQFHAALPHTLGESPLQIFESHHRSLLLMHHPRSWLSRAQGRLFDSRIYPGDRFTACLHGHMHEVDAVNTSQAGGAARCYYQAPSLFGMKHYGSAKESRAIGYTWASLRDDGELRAWPMRLLRKGDGLEEFYRDPFFYWEFGPGNVLLRSGDGQRWNRPRVPLRPGQGEPL